MIELLKEMPSHVAAFRATGKVTKDDYEKVVIPAVDFVAKTYKKIHFLLILDTDVANYSVGAWVDDALVGIKHAIQWRKIAIVSDQNLVKKITDIFGHLIPGETKGFKHADIEIAKKWVSE